MILRFILVLNWARDWLGDAASHHYFMTGLQIVTIVPFLSEVGCTDFVPHNSMKTLECRLIQGNKLEPLRTYRISSEADLKSLYQARHDFPRGRQWSLAGAQRIFANNRLFSCVSQSLSLLHFQVLKYHRMLSSAPYQCHCRFTAAILYLSCGESHLERSSSVGP